MTKERSYLDTEGRPRTWSYIERRGGRRAVVVAARTRGSGSLVLIRQFRVPFGRSLIELPAGLIDAGESPEKAALRELEEETGYLGEVLRVSPEISSSAGLTTETFFMVDAVVDEEPREQPRREGSEDIEVLTLKPGEAPARLREWERTATLLDCKAYLAILGVIRVMNGDGGADP